MNINMNQEALETIVLYLKEMASQDNRGTRAPYFFTIRDKMKVYTCEDNFDETEKDEDDDTITHYFKWVFVNKNMFLTERDAKRHLELNYYHYSDDAYVYLDYASRAPEMEKFFNALFDYFKIDKGNWRT